MTGPTREPDLPQRARIATPPPALADERRTPWRTVLSWAAWDWGTQPFNTVITTFVFAVYITGPAFGDKNHTSLALSVSTSVAGLLIALLAPVLGQNADRLGRNMRNLRILTWALAAVSAALFCIRPDPAYLWPGLALLGAGSIISEIASVNYNAELDHIATGRNVGRISGFGWGMGYLGGIVVLLLLYFSLIKPQRGPFGITHADGMNIRVSMLVCGLWTLLFTIPTFLALRDRPVAHPAARVGVWGSYAALGRSIRRLWRTTPHTIYFLLASALFRDGLAGVFAFGAVIAAGTFGFSPAETIVFGAAANILAGLATMALGWLDDVIGPKKVIMISLVSLTACGIAIFALHNGGRVVFWVVGLVMTLFVGPAQSASRSFLARLIPEGHAGEIFGLYATTGRVVSFLSPTCFGLAMMLGGRLLPGADVQYWGILGIVVVLAAGLAVMIPVREAQATIA